MFSRAGVEYMRDTASLRRLIAEHGLSAWIKQGMAQGPAAMSLAQSWQATPVAAKILAGLGLAGLLTSAFRRRRGWLLPTLSALSLAPLAAYTTGNTLFPATWRTLTGASPPAEPPPSPEALSVMPTFTSETVPFMPNLPERAPAPSIFMEQVPFMPNSPEQAPAPFVSRERVPVLPLPRVHAPSIPLEQVPVLPVHPVLPMHREHVPSIPLERVPVQPSPNDRPPFSGGGGSLERLLANPRYQRWVRDGQPHVPSLMQASDAELREALAQLDDAALAALRRRVESYQPNALERMIAKMMGLSPDQVRTRFLNLINERRAAP